MTLSIDAIKYGSRIAWKFHDVDEWRTYYAAVHGMNASAAAADIFGMIAAKVKGYDAPGPTAWGFDFAHDAVAHAMLILALA